MVSEVDVEGAVAEEKLARRIRIANEVEHGAGSKERITRLGADMANRHRVEVVGELSAVFVDRLLTLATRSEEPGAKVARATIVTAIPKRSASSASASVMPSSANLLAQ
ncbi:MAG TPA: hypothetical protein VGG41_12325 [Solirubrobacteraceae bacterium]|jgi:hypothetical protein